MGLPRAPRWVVPRAQAVVFLALLVMLFMALGTHVFKTNDSIYNHLPKYNLPSSLRPKSSKLHYIVPTTGVKPHVCANAVAALVNRYPAPMLVGYKGEGKFDAKAAHVAKLRTVQRYLHTIPKDQDDDLAIVVDAFDVLAMFGAEAMIDRYFKLRDRADQRLADEHSITVEELHARGMRQTLLWGTDKGCFPSKRSEPQCWLLPDSHLPRWMYGPKTKNGDLAFSESKFLNSGTVMGPVSDLRKLMDKAVENLDEMQREQEKPSRSDQQLISKMYARQEYYRTLARLDGPYPDSLRQDRELPKPKIDETDETEFHIFVDFETSFTMTMMHNDRFYHQLKYDQVGYTAHIDKDYMEEGDKFNPFSVQMPTDVYRAFKRTFDSLSEEYTQGLTANEWVRKLKLPTNISTQKIFAFWHKTGTKRNFVEKHTEFWYMPYIKPLLRASVDSLRAHEPISEEPIDGRMWYPAHHYSDSVDFQGLDGGFFTDYEGEEFIRFKDICTEEVDQVFGQEFQGYGANQN